jgi:hypothetical protein
MLQVIASHLLSDLIGRDSHGEESSHINLTRPNFHTIHQDIYALLTPARRSVGYMVVMEFAFKNVHFILSFE